MCSDIEFIYHYTFYEITLFFKNSRVTYIFVGFQADCFVDRHLSKDVSAVRDGLGGADITVTGPHPVFGSRPVSNQFGGCGTRGNGVSLPYTFLELEGVKHGTMNDKQNNLD